MEGMRNRYVVLRRHIDGAPQECDFEVKTQVLENGEDEQVVVKNLYISVDPYQLNRMKNPGSPVHAIAFSPPIIPGQHIYGDGVGRVVVSGNGAYEKGDLVSGWLSWGDYSIIKEGSSIRKLDTLGFPLSYHLGLLGLNGFTAYVGLFDVCKPKVGERMFVSAASGAVGNLVGQYAKLFGCYVVGCAGTQAKVDLLKGRLGFDDAFNYKEQTNLKATLKRYFPDGIDIYFDNVGGEMLEAAIENMNAFGRVAVCGVISEYAKEGERHGGPNMMRVLYKSITIQGFLAYNMLNLHGEFQSATVQYLKDGKLHVLEDVSVGLESISSAFAGLFRGDNVGKKIVQVAEDD